MSDHTRIDRADLRPLRSLGEFKVAKGYPDIRGWEVKTREGRRFGKVSDLIVSPAEMRVRYLDVDLDDGAHALIPIGIAQLDGKHDDVIVHELNAADVGIYPRYVRKDGIDRGYESSVWRHFSPDREAPAAANAANGAGAVAGAVAGAGAVAATNQDDFGYDSERYDDRRLLASHDDRMTALGSSGDVRRHEEISIDTQTITDLDRTAEVIVRENEIRIPLMTEWADGRRMPREEVVIRKRMVDGDKAQETRRSTGSWFERFDDRPAAGGGTAGTREGSVVDRAADRVDDAKDRIDMNPASRPGRDMTDRRGR